MRRKQLSFFSFQNFVRILSEKFFRLSAKKNFKKLSKLPSACPVEQFVAWNIFWKVWSVMDFLQKPLAWLSSFYIRVRSKNCGKNSFFCFLFRIFFDFWAKIFQTFGQIFKKLWKLTSACPQEQLVASKFFKKFLNSFGFSTETFGMVLKFPSTCPK